MTAPVISAPSGGRRAKGGAARLKEVEAFGTNPGALKMFEYAPPGLGAGAPLVVVLHGCTQNAEGYEAHAGWTALADELGFAVLYPEQTTANNPRGCFNWFLLADSARGLGETRSIREMVETMVQRHKLDRGRVFITGLSAGGAMTAALLKDYPEVFAAGAVIAGLPCGVAASVQEAYEAMTKPKERSPEELGDSVRSGAPAAGSWPRVAIWHGTEDRTVSPQNAEELAKQWVDVHGVAIAGYREDKLDGHRRRIWAAEGRDVVEQVMVAGMDHGTPLDAAAGERPGPFMLDAGVSSTRRIADFFGLAAAREVKSAGREHAAAPALAPFEAPEPEPAPEQVEGPAALSRTGLAAVWAKIRAAFGRSDTGR